MLHAPDPQILARCKSSVVSMKFSHKSMNKFSQIKMLCKLMSLTFCATVKMRTCETILFIQNMYLVNTVLSYFLNFYLVLFVSWWWESKLKPGIFEPCYFINLFRNLSIYLFIYCVTICNIMCQCHPYGMKIILL